MKYSRYFTQKLKEATFNLNCRCRPNILKCSRQIVFEAYVLILKCLEVKEVTHGMICIQNLPPLNIECCVIFRCIVFTIYEY